MSTTNHMPHARLVSFQIQEGKAAALVSLQLLNERCKGQTKRSAGTKGSRHDVPAGHSRPDMLLSRHVTAPSITGGGWLECQTFPLLQPDSYYPATSNPQFNVPGGVAVRTNLPINGSVVAEAVYVVSWRAWGAEGTQVAPRSLSGQGAR